MNSVLVIIDSIEQWEPYYKTQSITTALDYLQSENPDQHSHLIINLCNNLSYHSEGYYCSLLAQARKHKVIPSIDTLNMLEADIPAKLESSLVRHCKCNGELPTNPINGLLQLDIYFGTCEDPRFEKLARTIFDRYPAPLLRAEFSANQHSHLCSLRTLNLEELTDHQQDLFANALDAFNKKVWREPRSKKPARYDLAIFHDPEEQFPPSNRAALNLFINEAKKMNINAELITERESSRLMEFDALFIRQTTAVNHVTYRLAQSAQHADMVVIDDPSSIIRCTNKVFLKELLDRFGVPAPRSCLLFRTNSLNYQGVANQLGQTMVLKIPDGSFSVGVSKVECEHEFNTMLDTLFTRSSIILAQEFLPTEFDWRIGVLNGEPIFACKYYMARGHWQIYHHKAGCSTRSGRVMTVPVHEAPRNVIRLAAKVAGAIGKGLYGVDIKTVKSTAVVIEVNDNPSIDHTIEDKILGNELYRIILREFVRRLNAKRRG
ncbi:RimK family protein [Desulfosediminicola sp.]|uniref:RimK family protein n=1 Tax=Desulfosediminicola sp. TaxID=2886825 RepID=UPI003AF28F3D